MTHLHAVAAGPCVAPVEVCRRCACPPSGWMPPGLAAEIRAYLSVTAILPLTAKFEIANANPSFGNNDKLAFWIRFYN